MTCLGTSIRRAGCLVLSTEVRGHRCGQPVHQQSEHEQSALKSHDPAPAGRSRLPSPDRFSSDARPVSHRYGNHLPCSLAGLLKDFGPLAA